MIWIFNLQIVNIESFNYRRFIGSFPSFIRCHMANSYCFYFFQWVHSTHFWGLEFFCLGFEGKLADVRLPWGVRHRDLWSSTGSSSTSWRIDNALRNLVWAWCVPMASSPGRDIHIKLWMLRYRHLRGRLRRPNLALWPRGSIPQDLRWVLSTLILNIFKDVWWPFNLGSASRFSTLA